MERSLRLSLPFLPSCDPREQQDSPVNYGLGLSTDTNAHANILPLQHRLVRQGYLGKEGSESSKHHLYTRPCTPIPGPRAVCPLSQQEIREARGCSLPRCWEDPTLDQGVGRPEPAPPGTWHCSHTALYPSARPWGICYFTSKVGEALKVVSGEPRAAPCSALGCSFMAGRC